MLRFDLHAHSRFFHGFGARPTAFDPVGLRLAAGVARARGLDGLALTNHDYRYDGGGRVAGVQTVPGVEVSTTDGHVVVVGPDPPTATEPGALTPAETVRLAHDRGCAAIVAHPYRNSVVRESDADFDAVEMNGKSSHAWQATRELAERLDLPLVGGSDAHWPVEVGRAYTVVDADDPAPRAVADAVRDGRVEARVAHGPVERLLGRAYHAVHSRKDHVEPFEE